MTQYKEEKDAIVTENQDGSISLIPKDFANSDYQTYLESLEDNK